MRTNGCNSGRSRHPIATGELTKMLPGRRVLSAAVATGALIAASIGFAPGGVALVASVVGSLGILVGVRAVVLAQAVDFASRREGTTPGFVFALMDGVGALGAVLAGSVAELALSNAFLLAGCLGAVTVALALALPSPGRVTLTSRGAS